MPTARRTRVGCSRWVRHAKTASAEDDQADDSGDPAMEHVRGGDVRDRREQRAAHQRPVGEDEGRFGRGDVRPEQQQGEGDPGREGREDREPLARAAPADARRVTRPDRDVDEDRDEDQGAREVRRDGLPAVAEADRLTAEPGLEADEPDRRQRRPQDRAPVAIVADGQDGEGQDLEADDDGDGPMEPLEPRLRVAEGRDQLAVAQRPVRAAEPGIRRTDDDPDRDQPESGRESQRGELLEAVHEALILPRRRLPADRDTLSAMTPRRWLPLLALLALVAVACGAGGPSAAPSTADAWGPPATPPKLTPVLVTNAIAKGKARILFLYLDAKNNVASAPDRTAKVAFYDLDTDPAKPVTSADGEFVWTIENERGMYVVNVDLPTAGNWGAEFTTEAPGSPAETVRLQFPVRDSVPTIGIGQKAPASKTPTAADVGGDLTKISTDKAPDPAFYQTSVADALAAHKPIMLVFATPEVLHQPAVRPDARPFQADRRGQPGRDVHQRRAIPAQDRRRLAPAGARCEQPAPGDGHHQRMGPAVRAVDLRGRPERGRPGLVRSDDHAGRARRDPAGHHRGRLTAR